MMTRYKRFLSAFLALVLCIGILPITGMAKTVYNGLDNFVKTAAYSESTFTDVHKNDWFYENVQSVYEYALMRGKGNNCFAPESNVTLAETITIAARLHAQYYVGTSVFSESEPWYQTYADYAENCGILDEMPDNPDAPATRGEFAEIIARALPDSALEEINIVAYSGIPDVSLADSYGRAVYKLYRAGIMIGNDEKGTFSPESGIQRCEVAAIVTRMVDTALRKTIQLGKEHTVSFDLGYRGLQLDAQTVVDGYTATEPAAPVRQNYIFDGWYTEKTGGYLFAFETEILSDITLYAHWKTDPAWFAAMMNGFMNGDTPDQPADPDQPNDPDNEYDYGKLPYRPGKTWEELIECNGGEEPYMEMNDHDQVGLYIGKISDNKVEDVYDVIAELNNVRDLLNINDARFEFIPSYDDGRIDEKSYRVQQVHNGVQVWCAQMVVVVDDDGYIIGFISDYVDAARFASVGTTASVAAEQAVRIVQEDVWEKGYTVDDCTATLTLMPDINSLIWFIPASYGGKSYSYYVDAITGEILGCIENVEQTAAFDWTGISDDQIEDETFTFWGAEVDLTKISAKNTTDSDSYVLIDRSFYDEYLSDGNPNHYGVYVYNSYIDFDADADSLPGNIIQRSDNQWDFENTYIERAGLYAIYNFKQVMETYADVGFAFTELPIEVNVNLAGNNASYSHQRGNYVRFKFARIWNKATKQAGVDPIRNLDTVGHEYTHMVQDYYVNPVVIDGVKLNDSELKKLSGASLGSGYIRFRRDSSGKPEIDDNGSYVTIAPNSSNIEWVEAKGISEGTADVMGMLIESIREGIDIRSDEFWIYGENEKNELTYSWIDKKYPYGRDYRDDDPDDGTYHGPYSGHYSVQEMNEFYEGTDFVYQDQREDIDQKHGVGYNETPILIGILHYIIEHEESITAEELLNLWYTAITMLNAKSEFDHLRFALELAAKKLGMDAYMDSIIDACASVGITYDRQDNKYSAWFYEGLRKAYNNNIITEDAANNNADDIVTRRKYLEYLAGMCGKVGVEIDSDVITWAKGLHMIGDSWTGAYLDESIPKWQAALLMYQIFNHYNTNFSTYGWHPIYSYEYGSKSGTDYYAAFKNAGFADWISAAIPTDIDSKEMLQYYPGKEDITAFQQQYMFSYVDNINYVTGNKDDEATRYSLYYMGFYQLWRNGMFNGYSSSGKIRLGTTDSISLGEACALITQVIPD